MKRFVFFPLCILMSLHASAQLDDDPAGFKVGVFRLEPEVEGLGAYDNRVFNNLSDNTAEGDFYGEAAVKATIANQDARYDVFGLGRYGYRVYNEYSALDDDFYDLGAGIRSTDDPLKLGLVTYLKKTLEYDTTINPDLGQEPGSILTDLASTRFTARGDLGYEARVSERTTLEPGYELWYYYQDIENRTEDAEWVVHRARLRLGFDASDKTRLYLNGYFSVQNNEEEKGNIASATLGAQSRVSDKTTWSAEVGASVADYELSGTDQGLVTSIRGVWSISPKLSAYIYGGNDFQPGYSGTAARMVYRLGYGADWRVVERIELSGALLHDYQEALGGGGSDPRIGEVRHFLTLKGEYQVTKSFFAGLRFRYVIDERPTDKAILSLLARYAF